MVMRDWNMKSRTLMMRAIASVLTAVVLVLTVAVSVGAQDSPRIGLKIRTLTPELRKQNNLPEATKGALVTAVTTGSPAQEKGMVAGDVIVEVGGKKVDKAQAVAKSIAAGSASGSVSFKVMNSKGERRNVTVPVPRKPAAGSSPIVPGPK
jgi:S1-C subfamily serine protease